MRVVRKSVKVLRRNPPKLPIELPGDGSLPAAPVETLVKYQGKFIWSILDNLSQFAYMLPRNAPR